MSALALIIGIILGMTSFRVFKNYMNSSAKRQSEEITGDIFTIRKPFAKTAVNTVLLIVWISIFALYKNGLLFSQSAAFDILSVIIALMIFYQVYTCINSKVEVYNNTVTDKRGNRYFFTDFSFYRIIGTSVVVYFDNNPVIRVDRDDIGYERFLEMLEEYSIQKA